jgi:hydroxymethylbilane synthase
MVVEMLLRRVPGLEVEVVPITTAGDRLPPERRRAVDGKTAFTGDIQSLLLSGKVDAAVHSMKDVSVEPKDGLKIAATPPRGDPRDVLVSEHGAALSNLREGAAVGTSSLRRKAQLLNLRPNLNIVDLHGNVESRIERMNRLGLDAVVLAAAGVERIAESRRVSQFFSTEEMVPAVGQATLAVEVREGDQDTGMIISKIDDGKTRTESDCERAFARRVGGDCFVPVGAFARVVAGSLTVSGMIASPDGKELLRRTLSSTADDAGALGRKLGEEMLEQGGEKILRGILS